MDRSKLDLKKDRDIIPGALYATTPESFSSDILKLESIYTNNHIVMELKSTKEHISNEVCLNDSNRYLWRDQKDVWFCKNKCIKIYAWQR